MKLEEKYHNCRVDHYGDWSIDGVWTKIYLSDINHLLTKDKLKEVSFDEIAFKGKHYTNLRGAMCFCCDGARYYSAKTKIPGIIVEGMANPYGSRYRMIDGKHRIEKMIDSGKTSSVFYVLQLSDYYEFGSTNKKKEIWSIFKW